jgi:hypothetical protein
MVIGGVIWSATSLGLVWELAKKRYDPAKPKVIITSTRTIGKTGNFFPRAGGGEDVTEDIF